MRKIKKAIPGTVDAVLRQRYPEIMADFAQQAWDWKLIGPMGMDDPMELTVILEFGVTRCERRQELRIPLQFAAEAT